MNHKQIRIKRLKKGIRQQDVAKTVGISTSRLCQFEQYGVPIPVEIKKEIERILNKNA